MRALWLTRSKAKPEAVAEYAFVGKYEGQLLQAV